MSETVNVVISTIGTAAIVAWTIAWHVKYLRIVDRLDPKPAQLPEARAVRR